ncbi:NCS1 family nucleobase:cation symporter-1 [Mycobacterium sp. MAA66]|uniref:purine-cytosine permease family protein n=1 Tax=Mycobacterium sp. MAA66 TaxID=3156297 RepID=UPI003515C4F2
MAGVIETRSIDWIPLRERKGKVHHQAPFWFTGNFVLTTMVAGFLGPANGMSAGWSALAAVLGACFGTLFMCFHANQGPTMGLPQMIQSRAQFGSRGAVVPFIAVIFVYIGFNVFNTILATDGFKTVFPGPKWLWYLGLMVAAIVIAVVGFDLMMVVQRWLTYLLIAVFGVLTVYALSTLHLNSAVPDGGKFSLTVFFMQFAAAAGYQISYAVYVSDYSRYLPEETSAKRVIWWTYLGAAGSSVWLMSFGAVLASALPTPDAITSIRTVGNQLLPGFGTFTVVVSSVALLTIMSVNAYGASLTSMSALDAFRPIKPTVRLRVIGIALTSFIAFVVALSLPESYLGSFNTFVLLMLYFLIPWTAVNLVDFYFVRRGHYSIVDIFRPDGIYGRWSWRGLMAYVVGMVSMVPFVSLSFYTGPVATLLDGVDISFIVGLVTAGVVYYMLTRGLDLDAEEAAAERSRQELLTA